MIFFAEGIGEYLENIINQAFGVNFTEFLINLVGTIILILIIRFFFWDKVTQFLDAKKQAIEDEYTLKDNLTEEANKLNEEAKETLKEAKIKAQDILSAANDSASKEKEEIINSAKVEANKIISDSHDKALMEKNEIINEAKKEIVDVASLMASKIIDKEIDKDKYDLDCLNDLEDK